MWPLLLAMQASGMIMDWSANQNQIRLGRMGTQLEQAGINANIELTRAQAEDQSLESMKSLRQNLGSQIAISAARGVQSGAGSTASIFNESISNYNSDAQARRMNLLSREASLRAQGVLSGLHQLQSETQLGQSMTNRWLQNIPISSALGKMGATKSPDSTLLQSLQ